MNTKNTNATTKSVRSSNVSDVKNVGRMDAKLYYLLNINFFHDEKEKI